MALELHIPTRDEVSRLKAKDEHPSVVGTPSGVANLSALSVLDGPLVLGDDIGVDGCANIRAGKEVKIEILYRCDGSERASNGRSRARLRSASRASSSAVARARRGPTRIQTTLL